uniref:Uncharacterized protein n=1 Tax=Salix viminalis TaxID=40686 RepID=A0A6N2NJ42_SALVM
MSRTSSIGDSAELEGNLTLSDHLKVKNSHFDPNAFVTSKCQTMNEKPLYAYFYEKFPVDSSSSSSWFERTCSHRFFVAASKDSIADDHLSNLDERELFELEDWLIELLDNFEVLLAEMKVAEAMQALEKGEELANKSMKKHSLSPTALVTLETAIRSQRQKLAYQLAEAISQPSTRGQELRSAVLALKTLGMLSAMNANLKKIEKISVALAAADDWLLIYPPAGGYPFSSSASLGSAMASQPKLSSNANRFNSMNQDFLEDARPLESLQLDGSAWEAFCRIAETESQQLALLANASLLANELFPCAAMKLLPLPLRMDEQPKRSSERQSRLPEQREWKKKLQRSVDRLRDSFCRQHALDLIFTE